MFNYFDDKKAHMNEFVNKKIIEYFIPLLKDSKIFTISNIEELELAEKKCIGRLEEMIINCRNIEFIPITWEEELLLQYSIMKTNINPTYGKTMAFMGKTLKKVVFTYNPYES